MPANTNLANIRGLLVDLDGVLYVGDGALPGARDALQAVRDRGIVCRFLTNTTTKTADEVVKKLAGLGFEIEPDEIVTPVIATKKFLESRKGGKPKLHLLVRESVLPEFDGFPHDDEAPDYVIGDDIESDVGGGQNAGLLGILVKTGKYREAYAAESDVEPDAVIDSFGDLPGLLSPTP